MNEQGIRKLRNKFIQSALITLTLVMFLMGTLIYIANLTITKMTASWREQKQRRLKIPSAPAAPKPRRNREAILWIAMITAWSVFFMKFLGLRR